MKRLICALILLSSVCRAQDFTRQPVNQPPGKSLHPKDTINKYFFLSFNFGISVPLNNYGTVPISQLQSEIQGYAITGTHSNISLGVFLSAHIALIVAAGLDVNSVNQTLFAAYNGRQATSNFNVWQYMGGIYYKVDLSHKTVLSVQAMVGLISINYPSTSEYYNHISVTSNAQNGTGLGYSFGIGFEKMLTETIGAAGNLSYSSGQIGYPYSNFINAGSLQAQTNPSIMWFGSMQATVGLLLYF